MNTLLLSGPPGQPYGIPHPPGVQSFACCQETGSEAPRSMSGSRYITRRSPGTASRARCSAASMAAAIW